MSNEDKMTDGFALSHDEMIQIFQMAPNKLYQKDARVQARTVVDDELVVTTINGVKETERTATFGDVVITGPGGEEYVIGREKFLDRYEGPDLSLDNQEYKAKGQCYASEWTMPPARFIASWGEEMIIEPGDMLASVSPTGFDTNGKFDVYRIELEAFKKTYKPA